MYGLDSKPRSTSTLLCGLLVALWAGPAAAQKPPPPDKNAYRASFKNNTNNKAPATDLELTFQQTPKTGAATILGVPVTTGNVITFTGGKVPIGTSVDAIVGFAPLKGPFTLAGSEWSFDNGPNLKAPLASLGIDAFQVPGQNGGTAFVRIINDSPVAVTISDLLLTKDIDDSMVDTSTPAGLAALNSDTDPLFINDGVSVTPPQSTFTLQASGMDGSSILLDLGATTADTDVATVFSAVYSGGEAGSFGLISNASVPEPGSWLLLLLGLPALGLFRRFARSRKAAGVAPSIH
jgi:hypothetical protein